jgi:hypothetical protein
VLRNFIVTKVNDEKISSTLHRAVSRPETISAYQKDIFRISKRFSFDYRKVRTMILTVGNTKGGVGKTTIAVKGCGRS